MHKYLKGGCKEEGARFFSVVPSDRSRDNAQKMKYRRFCLNIRKHFFYHEGDGAQVSQRTESPFLEILKSHLYMVLGSLFYMTLQGVGPDDHQRTLSISIIQKLGPVLPYAH